MPEQPRISVITIVRNAPLELKRTVESVQGQTVPPFEHVIVDGASTDDTIRIAQSYAAHSAGKVTLISEKDSGIADALNKGARLASGDFLICMNAGDTFFAPTTLHALTTAISRVPVNTVLYGNVELVYADFRSRKSVRHEEIYSCFAFWNPLCHQAMAVPRQAMLKHPFNVSLRYSMDLDLWLQLLNEGVPFTKVNEFLCSYTIGGISSSPKNYSKIISEHLQVYRRHGFHRKYFSAILLRIRLLLEKIAGRPIQHVLKVYRKRRSG